MAKALNRAHGTRRGFLAGASSAGLASVIQSIARSQGVSAQSPQQPAPVPVATDYGVVVDGSTDNTPAFERLFERYAGTGATVLLPAGAYLIREPLRVPRHITLAFAHGARLAGTQTVHFEGQVEAGLYQIFDGIGTRFLAGSVQYVMPQWWGARGDGLHDDTTALQAALDVGLVFIPAGKYRTTAELLVRNRSTIVGVGNSWSPSVARDSWIQYDGPAVPDRAVLRVSTAKVGIEPRSALTNVHIEKILLNGGNRAGFGMYSAYCSDDSSFTDITARHCTQHGMFITQQWYSAYRNLVARNNSGCGVTIGRVFDGWRRRGVNGIQLSNIRAAQNGSDKQFHEQTKVDWGYGVLFSPGGGSSMHNVVAEDNYGAGLIYDLGRSCSNRIEGAYLEGNGVDARSQGAASRPWGLIVIGRGSARANSVSSVYLHGEVGNQRAQAVWLTGTAPNGALVLRDLSFGHFMHTEWDQYRLEGFIYYGLRNNVVGPRPR